MKKKGLLGKLRDEQADNNLAEGLSDDESVEYEGKVYSRREILMEIMQEIESLDDTEIFLELGMGRALNKIIAIYYNAHPNTVKRLFRRYGGAELSEAIYYDLIKNDIEAEKRHFKTRANTRVQSSRLRDLLYTMRM